MADENSTGDVRVERGDLAVDVEYIGEGINGDYDENDPRDMPLLRFSVERRTDSGWEAIDSSSYCTQVDARCDPDTARALANRVLDRLSGEAWTKRACEELSWTTKADLLPPIERLGKRLAETGFNGIEFDEDGYAALASHPAANTKFAYAYRDENNYKQFETAVFAGAITVEQIDLILEKLDEDGGFIPGQVGLPDLQTRFINGADEDDQPFHDIGEIGLTLEPANAVSIADFIAVFTEVSWDQAYQPA